MPNRFKWLQFQIQIGDFGLAKHDYVPVTPEPNKKELRRTESYHTSGVGTQAYAAPEQLSDGFIDERVRLNSETKLNMRFDRLRRHY